MDFLPPKPPKMAGADNKKKTVSLEGAPSTDFSSDGLQSIKDGSTQTKQYSAIPAPMDAVSAGDAAKSALPEPSAEESLPSFSVPDISPVEEETLDERITDISTAQQSEAGKKKGFFGRLFGAKDSSTPKKDSLTQGETTKVKEEEEVNNLRQALGMDDPSRKIALQEVEKTPDYVPRTSWDSEIVDIDAYRKPQDYQRSEDEMLREYKRSDYVKQSKTESKKENKKESKKEAKKITNKEIVVEIPKTASKSDDWVSDVAIEKLGASASSSSSWAGSPTDTKSVAASSTIIIPAASEPPKSKPQKEAFSNANSDWQKQVAALLSSSKLKDEKSAAQIEAKLSRLLKSYDSNFSKLVNERRKSIAADLDKLNRKQDVLAQKEMKLKEREAALQKRRDEIEAMPAKEEEFRKKKEAYEKEFDSYKKAVTAVRADMINAQKSFDFERKEFNVQRRDMQTELKKLRNSITFETKKGNAKLDALAKDVEHAQAKLEETQRSVKKSLDSLKTKEKELQDKENKVNALIGQEKKIITTLKEGVKSGAVVQTRTATASNYLETAEPEEEQMYIDDEDAVRQKVLDCKDMLKEENFEDAKMLYNEIRGEFSVLQADEAKKTVLKQEIRELYDEICTGIVSVRN